VKESAIGRGPRFNRGEQLRFHFEFRAESFEDVLKSPVDRIGMLALVESGGKRKGCPVEVGGVIIDAMAGRIAEKVV
jgi:hypothetical protein